MNGRANLFYCIMINGALYERSTFMNWNVALYVRLT